MKKPTYYITTPIYYPSGKWHLGHSYTTVCCDAIARYKRMSGFDVFYLTGTDEHGQKIEKRAAEAGQEPKVFVDGLVNSIKDLWKVLDIQYDKFIRTTDDYHRAAVQKIFKALYDKGDIYKAKYKGKYCTPCESFWTESQLKDGMCPDCGREVIDAEEESYFFRLSAYRDRILKLLTETDFLQPSSRVNEMVNNFLKDGLTDLAVSRTSFSWGIPVTFDEGHIVYVWIDALTNYISALGYNGEDDSLLKKYWPADLHMVGKEIVRFHSIIWPAILMALDLPLPKKVFGHGWLLFGGDKMSKSKGNVVDPFLLCERYGLDSIRYYLLREVPFGSDGAYTNESLLTRINSDLVNDYGNLSKRTLAMASQYFNGAVKCKKATEFDEDFISAINGLKVKTDSDIEKLTINKALEDIFDLIKCGNKYIDCTKPWVMNKEKDERLSTVIYNLLEALRVINTMLLPFLTQSPLKMFEALGIAAPKDFSSAKYESKNSYQIKEIDALFPRIDIKAELLALDKLSFSDEPTIEKAQKEEPKKNGNLKKEEGEESFPEITIDEFFKTSLRVGEVIAAEKVEKADKLLKLTVNMGNENRTIVSGIAKSYTPEELIGKRVVVVANLKPAKLRGIESQGMILCATNGDKVVIVSPETLVNAGEQVC